MTIPYTDLLTAHLRCALSICSPGPRHALSRLPWGFAYFTSSTCPFCNTLGISSLTIGAMTVGGDSDELGVTVGAEAGKALE